MRQKTAKPGGDGPDLLDAFNAVQGLWDDFQLHFRSTVVFRNNRLILRAYAHDRECLGDSDRMYQTYKQYELKGKPDLPAALYAMAFDLYWQAQSDAVNHTPDPPNALELP